MINFLIALLVTQLSGGQTLIDNASFLNWPTAVENVQTIEPVKLDNNNLGVLLQAEKYIAVDVATGKVLIEKNANVPQPMASISKLMTALVISDQQPKWKQAVELLEVDETIGAVPHINRGEQVSFYDLWQSALISSDNNSIMAMIRALGLERSDFVDLLNKKTQRLGLNNTHFGDPTGLDVENVSTATDIAKFLRVALQNSAIKQSVLQDKYSFPILNSKKTRTINSTDILLNSFLNDKSYGYELKGGKTGYLPESGYCLAVDITRDGHEVILVILNSPTITERFTDAKALADWVFSNYQWP